MLAGTRLPDATLGEPGPGWELWDNGACPVGSYMKVTTPETSGVVWYIRDPHGDIGSINPARHTVIEHGDDSISIDPSIAGGDWHGYLEHGVWRNA